MAQAGYTPIQLYLSTTASAVPSAGNLANGELAINITDGKLFYKDNGGVVRVLAGTGGTGVVAGSNTQLQFNNNGVFGASSGLTWDGTNLTASQLRSSGLTSGRVTYAGASGQLVDSANLLYSGTDLTVYGLTVGRGAGAVNSNTAVGISALAANTTGAGNTAVGNNAYISGATTNYNSAFGHYALRLNTGGLNTAVGALTLISSGAGQYNSALGYTALAANTTGNANVGLGGGDGATYNGALGSNTTGSNNTAVGNGALQANTTASNNTAMGYQAGSGNTTGAANVFFGYQAGLSSNSDGNTMVGRFAGYSVTSGAYNCFLGFNAGYLTTTGSKNTILGSYNGNQGGLDIRTSSNNVVLSDGDGNPRTVIDSNGNFKSTGTGNSTLYPEYKCRAWVIFNGASTPVINGSGNISSIEYIGTGDYRINFTTSMPDGGYAIAALIGNSGGGGSLLSNGGSNGPSQAYIYTYNSLGVQSNFSQVQFAVFR